VPNLYQAIGSNPSHIRLVIRDFLLGEYTRAVSEKKLAIWSGADYLMHLVSGAKPWHAADGVWRANPGESLFARTGKNVVEQQNLTQDVDAAAKKLLASEGYDPQFGARPLKRAIQEHLLDPLATKLLAGEFKPNDKIKVGASRDSLAFETR